MTELNRRRVLGGLGALAANAPMAAYAQQSFAGKTVRLVIGFNPGTPADVMGRLFIRPMVVRGGYLTHPYYDPLWAEIERLGLVAAVHRRRDCGTRNGPRTGRSPRK